MDRVFRTLMPGLRSGEMRLDGTRRAPWRGPFAGPGAGAIWTTFMAMLVVADFVAISALTMVAFPLAAWLAPAQQLGAAASPSALIVAYGALGGLLFVLALIGLRVPDRPVFANLRAHRMRVACSWLLAVPGAYFVLRLIVPEFDPARSVLILAWLLPLLAIALLHGLAVSLAGLAAPGAALPRRVFAVGFQEEIDRLDREDLKGAEIDLVGHIAVDPATPIGEALATADAVARARSVEPDDVVIMLPWSDDEALRQAVEAFADLPAEVHVRAHQAVADYGRGRTESLGSLRTIRLVPGQISGSGALLKRLMDIVLSVVGLIVLAPMLAMITLLVWFDSDGGVFYSQERRGYNRKTFRIYKFRSMRRDSEREGFRQAQRMDPRVTRVGRIIRKTSLDELPQLLNVLKGDMSLVGPRPHPMELDQASEAIIPLYSRRFNVKPGITGWAQVNGHRGETGRPEKMQARIAHDLAYIDNWSIFLDIRILFLTVLSPRTYRNAV